MRTLRAELLRNTIKEEMEKQVKKGGGGGEERGGRGMNIILKLRPKLGLKSGCVDV